MKVIFLLALFVLAAADEQYKEQFLVGAAQFNGKMYTAVAKSCPGKSVVLSAFSVLPLLAQLSLATLGESHDELLNAIGLKNDNMTRTVFPVLTQQLQSIKGVELKLANQIYIPQAYQLNKQFATDLKQVFGSDVKNIDFAKNTEAANEINQWVEDKTNNRIKNLVEPNSLGPDTAAVLVDALYFKGAWKSKFNKDLTTDLDFHVSADKTIKLPTMHKKDNFKYSESKELKAKLLEIPYEGGEASFLVVLPDEVEGLLTLEEKLQKNPALLVEASTRMFVNKVDVFLPKFKVETTIDLAQILQKIGVTKIFDAKTARLEHLIDTDKQLYVSKAVQKAFIEVNEEGAEAAAANVMNVLFKSARQFGFSFVADRPFLFGLKLQSPKTLLFTGTFKG